MIASFGWVRTKMVIPFGRDSTISMARRRHLIDDGVYITVFTEGVDRALEVDYITSIDGDGEQLRELSMVQVGHCARSYPDTTSEGACSHSSYAGTFECSLVVSDG